jgi:hypothetical protein
MAAFRSGVMEELGGTRAAITERLERLHDGVGVSFGRADAVQRVAVDGGLPTTSRAWLAACTALLRRSNAGMLSWLASRLTAGHSAITPLANSVMESASSVC